MDKPDLDGNTALSFAAENGHIEVIQELIKNGADINLSHFDDGATPLFVAAKEGQDSAVKTLLANGAKIDTPDADGASPLFIAAKNGHLTVVKALLANGADINTKVILEAGDLYAFAKKSKPEIANYINNQLIKGKNKDEIISISAIEIATIMGNTKVANFLQFQNDLKSLSNSKISTKEGLFSTSKTATKETITTKEKPILK